MYATGKRNSHVYWIPLAQANAVVNTIVKIGSNEGGRFRDWVSDYKFLKRYFGPWSRLVIFDL
jgi:hypothetical protein